MWRYLFLIVKLLKLDYMDYKMAARSHEFNKKNGSISSSINQSTINSFEAGYEYCQKEYEEKLRWTHVFEELPDLNSVIELKSENKRFLGIVKLKNYQGENRYYVQGMYQATGDIDILYNFSHWRKAIL